MSKDTRIDVFFFGLRGLDPETIYDLELILKH